MVMVGDFGESSPARSSAVVNPWPTKLIRPWPQHSGSPDRYFEPPWDSPPLVDKWYQNNGINDGAPSPLVLYIVFAVDEPAASNFQIDLFIGDDGISGASVWTWNQVAEAAPFFWNGINGPGGIIIPQGGWWKWHSSGSNPLNASVFTWNVSY